jgi:hypothetical protein
VYVPAVSGASHGASDSSSDEEGGDSEEATEAHWLDTRTGETAWRKPSGGGMLALLRLLGWVDDRGTLVGGGVELAGVWRGGVDPLGERGAAPAVAAVGEAGPPAPAPAQADTAPSLLTDPTTGVMRLVWPDFAVTVVPPIAGGDAYAIAAQPAAAATVPGSGVGAPATGGGNGEEAAAAAPEVDAFMSDADALHWEEMVAAPEDADAAGGPARHQVYYHHVPSGNSSWTRPPQLSVTARLLADYGAILPSHARKYGASPLLTGEGDFASFARLVRTGATASFDLGAAQQRAALRAENRAAQEEAQEAAKAAAAAATRLLAPAQRPRAPKRRQRPGGRVEGTREYRLRVLGAAVAARKPAASTAQVGGSGAAQPRAPQPAASVAASGARMLGGPLGATAMAGAAAPTAATIATASAAALASATPTPAAPPAGASDWVPLQRPGLAAASSFAGASFTSARMLTPGQQLQPSATQGAAPVRAGSGGPGASAADGGAPAPRWMYNRRTGEVRLVQE